MTRIGYFFMVGVLIATGIILLLLRKPPDYFGFWPLLVGAVCGIIGFWPKKT